MSQIIDIMSASEFEEAINKAKPVVVDFWATWCGPCKMQAPILHEFNDEVGDKVSIVKVDVDQNEKLAVKMGIMSIPTILVFKEGKLVEKSIGLTSKAQLSEMVIKHL